MAQPTIVGDSGKVNGKHAGASSSGRQTSQNASMKTRQPMRESAPGSRASRSNAPRAEESTRPSKRPSGHPRRGGVAALERDVLRALLPSAFLARRRRVSSLGGCTLHRRHLPNDLRLCHLVPPSSAAGCNAPKRPQPALGWSYTSGWGLARGPGPYSRLPVRSESAAPLGSAGSGPVFPLAAGPVRAGGSTSCGLST